MMYDLPTTVDVAGVPREIRSDYRAILDICRALNDPELSNEEKAFVCLGIFYVDDIEPTNEALTECFRFIGGGKLDTEKKGPKLMDWEQDFQFIVAPVNKVIGQEIRALPYLHWWTFLSAYYEIGECTFSQIVRIRDQKARGKALDQYDQKWYREHRDLVDIKTKYTEAENKLLKQWGV